MKSNLNFFKKKKSLSVDKFFQNVLYDKKFGYYSTKLPLGEKGDFITTYSKSEVALNISISVFTMKEFSQKMCKIHNS